MGGRLIRFATALAWRGQAVNLGVGGQPKVEDAKTQTNQFVFFKYWTIIFPIKRASLGECRWRVYRESPPLEAVRSPPLQGKP